MNRLILILGLSLFVNGCTNIWNGADLRVWVHKQAIKSGCEPNSIVLDEWYTRENGHNIWHGTCNDKHGDPTQLRIGVDKVWKPSGN
jgi:hypothetical protein